MSKSDLNLRRFCSGEFAEGTEVKQNADFDRDRWRRSLGKEIAETRGKNKCPSLADIGEDDPGSQISQRPG